MCNMLANMRREDLLRLHLRLGKKRDLLDLVVLHGGRPLQGVKMILQHIVEDEKRHHKMLKDVIKYGRDDSGTGMLINVGRDILYTSDEKDFAEKVRQKTQQYERDMSNLIRTSWEYI